MTTSPENQSPHWIGLIAGWGRYPMVVAEALRRQGRRVACVGFKQHADPRLRELCDAYQEVGVARLGAAIRFLRKHHVRTATMAGKIHKTLLFQRWYWLKHLPDWRCVRAFAPHFITMSKDRKDDSLLGTVVEAFAEDGIQIAPATNFVPEVLVKQGILTRRAPSHREWRDIEFGWKVAKELGRLDVGQSVAVKGRAVLALEAVEGTDRCIRRAGELCPAGGFTVVKVAKPQQDMRFDVPTIGMGTMESLAAAGARVLAVEASKTIVIDEQDVVAFANRHQLSIVSLAEVPDGSPGMSN